MSVHPPIPARSCRISPPGTPSTSRTSPSPEPLSIITPRPVRSKSLIMLHRLPAWHSRHRASAAAFFMSPLMARVASSSPTARGLRGRCATVLLRDQLQVMTDGRSLKTRFVPGDVMAQGTRVATDIVGLSAAIDRPVADPRIQALVTAARYYG